MARQVSPVLLYHSTFTEVPSELGTLVHNVHPDRLEAQIRWLQHHFEFISIDEWFERGGPRRTACVTFDDGYSSVMEEALPRLIGLGVPATVFLNGSSFSGETFWRDRVVHVVNNGLTEDFLTSTHAKEVGLDAMEPELFYKHSRRLPWSSRAVDQALTAFLAERGLAECVGRYTASEPGHLVDHELGSYGCHAFRRYLPSSLTREEQAEEIGLNQRFLDDLGANRSRVFSIPFGGLNAVDDVTIELLEDVGYSGVVFSRHAQNFGRPGRLGSLPTAERYMVPDDLRQLQVRHLRLGAMPPDTPIRRGARRMADLVRA